MSFKEIFPFLNPQNSPMLDSVGSVALDKIEAHEVNLNALNSEIQSLRRGALAVAIALAVSITDGDIAEDELPTDRLDALLAGIATDADDEEFEVDKATLDIVIANVQDALSTLGVSDDLIVAMFGGDADADEAIESASEIVISNLPSDEDMDEFIDLFVYGEAEDDEDHMLDGVALGKTTTKSGKFGKVVYKAVKAIRNGKVSIVNKRVSGKVKLSAKQRSALNKARAKASATGAIKKRMRSMKKARDMKL